MDSRKRKPKEDAVHPYKPSHEKDELVELSLHVMLRIAEAKRLGLPKVRLEMLDMVLAERLLNVIRKEMGWPQC
jgi:hypothetical protein